MDTPPIIAASLWDGTVVERSLFGTAEPDAIWARVRDAVPEAVDCFHFECSVGALLGVLLDDGTRAALKVHLPRVEERFLDAVQRVQAHLVGRGFPCTSPKPAVW